MRNSARWDGQEEEASRPPLSLVDGTATIESRYQELSLLHEISQAVLGTTDLPLLADQFVAGAMRVGAYDLGLLRFARGDGSFEVVAHRGFSDPANVPPTETNPNMNFHVLPEARTALVEDVAADPRFPRMQREGIASLVLVPIFASDEALGFFLMGKRTRHCFAPDEIKLLEAIGDQAGIALQKARLYAETAQALAELKRAETARSQVIAIFETTPDLIFTMDVVSNEVYLNQAGRKLLGFGPDEVLTLEQITAHEPAWVKELMQREGVPTAEREGVWSGEVAYINAQGQEVPVDTVLIAHPGEDGATAFFSAVCRDISERKQIEQRLLRAERLETAVRIAGQVAHNFNNLLAPLMGFPELMKMQLPPGHRAIEYCDMMIEATEQMAQINEDLLAFGRRSHVEQQRVDLNALIEHSLWQAAPLPQTLKIDLRLQADLADVCGSPAQLGRLVMNLLRNAREAVEDDGRVTIQTSMVYLDRIAALGVHLPAADYVLLQVSDTGVGIDPEVRGHIFDAFFSTKTADKRRGAGLGLSVVQAVVDDHEGYLDVASEPGSGSTFSVYLQVAPRQP